MRSGILVSLILSAGMGCLRGPSDPLQEEGSSELPILWQKSGHDDRIKRPFRFVAYDARTLAKLPLAEVPVDFDKQMVLIAAAGTVRSEKVEIRIRRVWKQANRIHARVEIVHPATETSVPRQRYCPYHIVVVPKSDLNVEEFSTVLPNGAFKSGGPD